MTYADLISSLYAEALINLAETIPPKKNNPKSNNHSIVRLDMDEIFKDFLREVLPPKYVVFVNWREV